MIVKLIQYKGHILYNNHSENKDCYVCSNCHNKIIKAKTGKLGDPDTFNDYIILINNHWEPLILTCDEQMVKKILE